MVTIRLARHGKRNDPFYRVVAIEKSKKRGGKALEVLGTWHPAKKDLKIDTKKVESWVSRGAQISTGVRKLLDK